MRTTLNFNANWAFCKDQPQAPETMPESWESVSLPHTWNAIDGQDGGNDYFRGTCCYAKSFRREDLPQGEKVYLNGKKLAHHDGGFSTWRVNLTDSLADENLLCILVDNAPNSKVYPQVADFTFYGGLYRNVNLICVPESHFDLD